MDQTWKSDIIPVLWVMNNEHKLAQRFSIIDWMIYFKPVFFGSIFLKIKTSSAKRSDKGRNLDHPHKTEFKLFIPIKQMNLFGYFNRFTIRNQKNLYIYLNAIFSKFGIKIQWLQKFVVVGRGEESKVKKDVQGVPFHFFILWTAIIPSEE